MSEKIMNFICNLLVRKKIHNQFGGNLQAFISGGGAIDQNIGKFLNVRGLTTLQGYGLNEATLMVSCNLENVDKEETLGQAFRNK